MEKPAAGATRHRPGRDGQTETKKEEAKRRVGHPLSRSEGPILSFLFRVSARAYFLAFFLRALRHHLADLVYLEHFVTIPLVGGLTIFAANSTISLG